REGILAHAAAGRLFGVDRRTRAGDLGWYADERKWREDRGVRRRDPRWHLHERLHRLREDPDVRGADHRWPAHRPRAARRSRRRSELLRLWRELLRGGRGGPWPR